MRTKLWMGVGAFVVAQSGQAVLTEAAAKPMASPIDQVGEGGENERGEGEGEGEGRQVVRSTKSRHVVRNPRRAHAARQHAGQRGEGEYEGGENERGEGGEGER
jgi:hypothetical protein